MSEIQQNRYDQLLRRVCDLKGPGSKVNWSLGDLMPVLDVEDAPAELQVLMGSRLSMGTMLQGAGGVGNLSKCIIRNPTGSSVVARLIEINVQLGTASGNIAMGPTQNSDVAGGSRAFSDTRVFGQGTAVVLQGNNNLLVAGSSFWIPGTDADGRYTWTPPPAIAVLAPGGGFEVTNLTANDSLRCNWLWLERTAQPSELNI